MDPPARSLVPGTRPVRVLLVLAVVVGSVAISPYVLLDSGTSRVDVTGGLHYALLVAHIFTAMTALVLGPLQFVPAIRANRARHRRIGRAYLLVGVVPSGLFGIPVALLSDRLVTQIGLLIPAVGWLVTAWLAVRAIRRGDLEAHRSWMTRNYALTFLAVTARILVPLMLLVRLPFTGEGLAAAADAVPSVIPIGQVLGWVVNLVIAEIVISRRRALPRRRAVKEKL
ncbi:DUF2306 domain-containing protein [Pseudonocardia sp. MH-G8]|uniref:DUF2306 domain-containing protein n=1 Tax=Pseudonocardia sp. MH-G8 TaxID=1854588 RepID=UPI000BA150F1|nr:DUF2306 domain-containing protein [Pseudonocardia sp. MH-G8]OZM82095.1 hypothetical protein CFP66_09785 [Pseudonocardia sp. MH-G8]